MKKTFILLAGAILAFAPAAFAASPKGSLPAPTNLICNWSDPGSGGDGSFTADWDDVAGAKKYAAELTAYYDLDGDGCADYSVEIDQGTVVSDTSGVEVPFDTDVFTVDVNGDQIVDTPIKIVFRVKGLNPPKGGPNGSGSTQDHAQAECVLYDHTDCTPVE